MGKEGGYQPQSDETQESKEQLVMFNTGTVIYPAHSSRGVLRAPLNARKLPGKIKGLSGYEASSRVDLYFKEHYWSLPSGTQFGAYASKAKKPK
jgi:hypothetical protein